MLQAPLQLSEGLVTYSARSDFNTESGAITGDSLVVGGTWGGAGAAGDFSVSGGIASRSTANDAAGIRNGRQIFASGPTLSTVAASGDFNYAGYQVATRMGLMVRRVDANNWLALIFFGGNGFADPAGLELWKCVAGTETLLAKHVPIGSYPSGIVAEFSLRVLVNAEGIAKGWINQGNAELGSVTATDPVLASGGTLDDGGEGLVGHHPSVSAGDVVTVSSFAAWVPTTDAVIFPSQSAELATDGITREDATGAAYGPVSIVSGDLPRIPNASSGGTVEVFLKASRGDLETLPDPAIDNISARVYQRPCWLYTPE